MSSKSVPPSGSLMTRLMNKLPSSREHRIFIAIVLTISLIVLIIGAGKFNSIGGFFETYKEDCSIINYDLPSDDTFQCPNPVAQERTLCVSDWVDCPALLNCSATPDTKLALDGTCVSVIPCDPALNESLECGDGTCVDPDSTSCPEDPESPCDCGVPCAIANLTDDEYTDLKVGIVFPKCSEGFDTNYSRSYYIFFQVWLAVCPALLFVWCFINQRIIGRTFTPTRINGVDNTHYSVQSGYNFSVFGYVLFWLQLLTIFYIHFCLVVLTVSYYNIDNEVGMWYLDQADDRRTLKAFEIVWMVGFAFMVLMLWPSDLKLHFMLRARLDSAQCVRIWIANPTTLLMPDMQVKRLFTWWCTLEKIWNGFFALLFSDVTLPSDSGSWTTCFVTTTHDGRRVITHQLRVLVYNSEINAFVPFPVAVPNTVVELIEQGNGAGVDVEVATQIRQRSGPNKIDVPKPEIFSTLVAEFSRPFYTYQAFMAWTYFNFSYWHMGILNTCVYSLSGLTVARISYLNRYMLYNLVAGPNSVVVRAKKNGVFVNVSAVDLVPGDVIAVEKGLCVADVVLVRGYAVMDESSLTGEAMPVHKVALDPAGGSSQYNKNDHKKSTLRAGTVILQGANKDQPDTPSSLGVVIATGCNTLKGSDVSEILFCPPPLFKFDVQVKIVVLILLIYGIIMFSITLKFLDSDPTYAWFYAMYVIATALPPLLPSVFVVSVAIAAGRLKERGVICSDPNRLLVAGKVRVCCFDKTGTLTKSSMEFQGVRVMATDGTPGDHMSQVPAGTLLESVMASCHALSKLNDTLIGAAVDVIMFEATKWTLNQQEKINVVTSSDNKKALHVIRRFDFDHHRMTSSVVAMDPATKEYYVFVKGSAESIVRYLASCNTSKDVISMADDYSRHGSYTLAVASRTCTAAEIANIAMVTREVFESDLTLTGLIMFRNELKSDSTQAITLLKEGACKPVMLTGDHILTGVFMAKEVGILSNRAVVVRSKSIGEGKNIAAIEWVDERDAPVPKLDFLNENLELAILGEIWRELSFEEQCKLLPFTRVWARTSPTDKLDVINLFINMGFVTSMCGDGGNDCGALRAAHVGIALSDSDASVVSPFTSINKTCMSVVDVLLEGRASLASAFSCYMYMLMYGQVETINQVANAWYHITFGEWNWIFMDGFWVVTLSYSLAFSKPGNSLARCRPTSSLLGTYTMCSMVGLIIIDFIFLVVALALLNGQHWYSCRMWDKDSSDLASLTTIGDNYESTVIFLVTGAQYLSSSMAFNFGHKYRQPWLYNWRLTVFLVGFFIIHTIIIFYPCKLSCLFRVNCDNDFTVRPVLSSCPQPVSNTWNTTIIPYDFRVTLFLLCLFNTIIVMIWTRLVVFGPVGSWFRKMFPNETYLRMDRISVSNNEKTEPAISVSKNEKTESAIGETEI